MEFNKKTKIVATLGLVSDTEEVLRKLIENGMNVARLNFSHGDHAWHGNVIRLIRKLSSEMGKPVGILADLQGPRIRTAVKEEVLIKKGENVAVSDIGKEKSLDADHQLPDKNFLLDVENIVDDINVGNEILIEDGLIKILVKEKKDSFLICEVIDEGVIKNHKGVNIPDAKLNIDVVTEKDEKDLVFALDQGVEFVALSFVGSAQDLEGLKTRIRSHLGDGVSIPQVIPKIERREAIRNLDEIISASDAVMVARGDLGIEEEGARVAVLQKKIIKKCLQNAKPVIVATQMLNSMIENPRPTRAEISDVTNAVIDHADAVMLSGETASGKYPLESVKTMSQIIRETEVSPYDDIVGTLELVDGIDYNDIAEGAYDLSRNADIKAIAVGSATGLTARLISHFRPEQAMLVVTDSLSTYNQLSLVWGVTPYLYEKGEVFREDVDWLLEKAGEQGFLKKGDKVVMVLGRAPKGEKIRLFGIKEIE